MLANWVQESTATTGTGAISLGGAAAGYVPFSSAFASGDAVFYVITDGNNREMGMGTLTSGTPWTLSRDAIFETLNAGTYTRNPATGISLSGSAVVGVDPVAAGEIGSYNPSFGTGNYISNADNLNSSTFASGIGIANLMFLIPVYVFQKVTFSTLACIVSTADAAATNTRFGMYKTSTNGGVGPLIFDSGDLSALVGTTGVKTSALGATVNLNPGAYWIAWTSGSTTLRFTGRPSIGGNGGSNYSFTPQVQTVSGITGALPASPTIGGTSTTGNVVFGWKP